jgi:hypothetical protein
LQRPVSHEPAGFMQHSDDFIAMEVEAPFPALRSLRRIMFCAASRLRSHERLQNAPSILKPPLSRFDAAKESLRRA